MRMALCCVVALLLLLTLGVSASGSDFNWKSAVPGDFSTPDNWQPTGPPGPADTAIFNLGSAGYTASLTPAITTNVGQLKINNDTVTFDSTGGATLYAKSLTQPSIGLGNNAGDVADLTLGGGLTLQGDSVWIGVQQGAQGTLTVNGGSMLTTIQGGLTSGLVVGAGGEGTLSVKSGTANIGGQITIARDALSEGTLSLDGTGSKLTPPTVGSATMTGITVGNGGNGLLSVTSGAEATVAGPVMVGQNVGSQGSIYLNGANSLFAPASAGGQAMTAVTVGGKGQGSLTVSNGAAAKISGPLVIGESAGADGSVSIDGVNSTLARPGFGGYEISSVDVGKAGKGQLSITHGATATLGGLVVVGRTSGAEGSVTVDGSGSSLKSNSSGQQIQGMTIAASGTGTLSVTNGAVADVAAPVYVGGSAGSHGTVTVDGGNSRLASSDLTVGIFGSGELHISAAGVVNTPQAIALGLFQGSSGIITIDGANSRLSGSSSLSSQSITVGKAGTGRLDITHGGSLSAPDGILTIGADKGSSGIVTVSGPGSQLTVTPNGTPIVFVGRDGIGTLNGSNGATIHTGSAYVGMKSGSSPATGSGAVTLDGRGTVWNAVGSGGTSFIGRSESGSVKVTNGAEFSTAQTFLGYSAGGVGTAEVTGTGSRWALNSNLTLGENGGTGTLSISGGGQVAVTGPNSVTINPGSSIDIHQATLSASTINTAGALINDGTITGNVKVYVGGTLSGSGTISGQLSVLGGNISPGNSPGMQTAGDVAFNSATYQFEINSANGIAGGPIGWDLLKSQTSATLAGITTLHLSSLDQANDPGNLFDFNPALDYHWTFLTSSTGISGFDAASFLIDTSGFTNPIGGHFSVSQVGNSLQLNYLVPEPSSFVLAGAALAGLVILARQKAGRTKHNSRKRLSGVGG